METKQVKYESKLKFKDANTTVKKKKIMVSTELHLNIQLYLNHYGP